MMICYLNLGYLDDDLLPEFWDTLMMICYLNLECLDDDLLPEFGMP